MGRSSGQDDLGPRAIAVYRSLWCWSVAHEVAGYYRLDPTTVITWTLRALLISQRYVKRDRWRELRSSIQLAGGKFDTPEPDWFGVAYGIPVQWGDFDAMKRQWEANVQPEVDKLTAEGAFVRQKGGKE